MTDDVEFYGHFYCAVVSLFFVSNEFDYPEYRRDSNTFSHFIIVRL